MYEAVRKDDYMVDEDLLYEENLEELQEIKEYNGTITIGAGCTLSNILDCEIIPEILRKVIKNVASPAIRNVMTIAKHIYNTLTSGDVLSALYALNSECNLISSKGRRRISIEEFIEKTNIAEDELLESISFKNEFFNNMFYKKTVSNSSASKPKVGCIALARVEKDRVSDIRIVFTEAEQAVKRSRCCEEIIVGKNKEEIKENIGKIIKKYSEIVNPIALDILKNYLIGEKVSID